MQNERKHELETNSLDNWLATKVEALVPYKNLIFGSILAIFIVWAGYLIYSNHNVKELEKSTGKLAVADASLDNIKALATVSKEEKGKPQGDYAALIQGQEIVTKALSYIGKTSKNDRMARKNLVEGAMASFEQLAKSPNKDIRAIAIFGKGKAQEADCNYAEALKYYEQVVEMKETTSLALAQAKVRELKRASDGKPAAKEFLVELVTKATPEPKETPSDASDLPLSLPETTSETTGTTAAPVAIPEATASGT